MIVFLIFAISSILLIITLAYKMKVFAQFLKHINDQSHIDILRILSFSLFTVKDIINVWEL